MVEDRPETLNRLKITDLYNPVLHQLSRYLNGVDFFQISLIFCCGYSLSCPEIKTNDREKDVETDLLVYPKRPCRV